MKHLKTYKIFESITEKEIDDVALDIRDILLPLKHDRVNFKVDSYFVTNPNYQHYIEVKIKDMNIKKYINELRQLVSTLDEEDWSIINDRDISDSLVVLTGDYDLKCTRCYSKDVYSLDPQISICNNCGYGARNEKFNEIYHIYFNSIDEMIEIIENRNIELINFRFYKI